jgi:hypothetical protein
MDTSLDFPESKQIKNYTETDKNKEFRTKIFESVEAKLITVIPINTATSTGSGARKTHKDTGQLLCHCI